VTGKTDTHFVKTARGFCKIVIADKKFIPISICTNLKVKSIVVNVGAYQGKNNKHVHHWKAKIKIDLRGSGNESMV